MMGFITPIILIGASAAVFFMFANPMYKEIGILRSQVASYDEALNNSKILESERDKLTNKYNSIKPEDLAKLERLLPEDIDNIRLILEIEEIADNYNMDLTDISYNPIDTTEGDAEEGGGGEGVVKGPSAPVTEEDYGVWDLSFSTTASYNDIFNFIRGLDQNLRIVDISSIDFSPGEGEGSSGDSYGFDFKVKTYWLK